MQLLYTYNEDRKKTNHILKKKRKNIGTIYQKIKSAWYFLESFYITGLKIDISTQFCENLTPLGTQISRDKCIFYKQKYIRLICI